LGEKKDRGGPYESPEQGGESVRRFDWEMGKRVDKLEGRLRGKNNIGKKGKGSHSGSMRTDQPKRPPHGRRRENPRRGKRRILSREERLNFKQDSWTGMGKEVRV